MKIIILINVLLLVPFVLSQETETVSDNKDITTVKIEDNDDAQMMTTVKSEAEISTETAPIEAVQTEIIVPTEKVPAPQSSTTSKVETETNEEESEDSEENFENSHESSLPSFQSGSSSQRRKIIYLNQQQHGKLNVQFELNDVSLIVVPNGRDPQLSLLDLLLKSAQKSIMNDMKKKEDVTKVNANNEDDYSKYNYMRTSTNEPSIESRAPYRVDISSTLNSQPVVEFTHQSEESHVTKSPVLKVKKPIVFQSPQSSKSKRSIENNLVGSDNDVENIPIDSEEDREIINSIIDNENSEEFIKEQAMDSTSEFILLGATENCGPGRRRNSYQICVAVAE
ncbi:uncharacterized protein [Chironomus tepperi]|uniref:uncharacterized protein n=1 Tax=Chironomus tepperi TaxID=113505 RepID=UPI00391F285F